MAENAPDKNAGSGNGVTENAQSNKNAGNPLPPNSEGKTVTSKTEPSQANADKSNQSPSPVKTEDKKATAEANKNAPNPPVNLTAAQHGVAGQVDLTQGGTLNSDKSVRQDKTSQELDAEAARTAGPNPLPNRDGNEITKAYENITSTAGVAKIRAIDGDTNAMAVEIDAIARKTTLSAEDKDRLESISKRLREMGKL